MTLAATLVDHWYRTRPSWLAQALRPLAWLHGTLRRLVRWRQARQAPVALPVPVVVVGNIVAGGAGKTPTVIAIVQLLQQHGWHPGVISRGHGRRTADARAVLTGSAAADVGDEPLLIQRRTGAPCWVGRARPAAARALLKAHPDVDVLVSDDGLQHAALVRDVEVVVFDERGLGNGLLLPAGPLRQPLAEIVPTHGAIGRFVLYNAAAPSTALAGHLARRNLVAASPLGRWAVGDRSGDVALATLHGRPLVAAAGLAVPERFFQGLDAAGLQFERCPLPDHFDYATLPWPASGRTVLTTEKDAVKLDPAAAGNQAVWVIGLDFELPQDFARLLLQRLGPSDCS